MRSYLIRVLLPDRPGALGAVASRIGSVGGDVVSIDILQREDGLVIDELGVGLASDDLVNLVRAEILEVDGVSIESIRPIEGPMPDRLAELLDVATDLFSQWSRTELLDRLVVHLRRSLGASFVAVVDAERRLAVATDGEVPGADELAAMGRLVSESLPAMSAADRPFAATSARHVGLSTARSEGDTGRPGVVTAELTRARLVLVVGRDDPVLRARERQWISIMAELADQCCRALPTLRLTLAQSPAAQCRDRSTLRDHAAWARSASSAGDAGEKVVCSCHSARSSSSEAHNPTDSPAMVAAPRAVVSTDVGRRTASRDWSATCWRRRSMTAAPPSTRTSVGAMPVEAMVSSTSRA